MAHGEVICLQGCKEVMGVVRADKQLLLHIGSYARSLNVRGAACIAAAGGEGWEGGGEKVL